MKLKIILMAMFMVLCYSPNTYAYVGPGMGLGVIGTLLGVLFSIVLAIIALFWYPLKRLLGLGNKRKKIGDDSIPEKHSPSKQTND